MRKPTEGTRVLYVCPLAHRAGHYPNAATKESQALRESGLEVSICTFQGILDQKEPLPLPQQTVVSRWMWRPLAFPTRLLARFAPTKGLAWFLEQLLTVALAAKLRKSSGYDAIYLRDGDPFIFIPFAIGLVLKDYRWAISLIGYKKVRSGNSLFRRFINAPFWKPIYHRSLKRNRFTFLCENKYIREYYEENFLGGILRGSIKVVPLGVEMTAGQVSQNKARDYLKLPRDKTVFLHFGALHAGKDIETALASVKDVPNTLLIHAGKVTSSVNLKGLVQRYRLEDKVIMKDYYIPEAEKHYYFAAADAIILSYKRDFWQTTGLLWEAAGYKLPAIASDSGELGELVKKYRLGLVFEAQNTASLKEALHTFIATSQEEKKRIRDNYQTFRHDFSLSKWAQRCLDIF